MMDMIVAMMVMYSDNANDVGSYHGDSECDNDGNHHDCYVDDFCDGYGNDIRVGV